MCVETVSLAIICLVAAGTPKKTVKQEMWTISVVGAENIPVYNS